MQRSVPCRYGPGDEPWWSILSITKGNTCVILWTLFISRASNKAEECNFVFLCAVMSAWRPAFPERGSPVGEQNAACPVSPALVGLIYPTTCSVIFMLVHLRTSVPG